MLLQSLPDGVGPLVVGTVLALGGLTIVLWPLINDSVSADSDSFATSTSSRNKVSSKRGSRVRRSGAGNTGEHDSESDESSDSAIAALREIEFDRETGKLSDEDYDDLKERYTRAALAEMRANESASETAATEMNAFLAADLESAPALGQQDNLSPVELAISRAKANQRSCGVCGPRAEPDAIYCSSCGRYLPGDCGHCGAPVQLVGSRFCSSCGDQLAAA